MNLPQRIFTARTSVRKTTRGTGAMEDITVTQAAQEAVEAGWTEFAARDHLRHGYTIVTREALYHVN